MHKHLLFLGLAFCFATATFSQSPPWQLTETITGAHDPSIVRDNKGVYTPMTTNNLLEIRQSTNMVNWTSRGRIFNSLPSWMTAIYSNITGVPMEKGKGQTFLSVGQTLPAGLYLVEIRQNGSTQQRKVAKY